MVSSFAPVAYEFLPLICSTRGCASMLSILYRNSSVRTFFGYRHCSDSMISTAPYASSAKMARITRMARMRRNAAVFSRADWMRDFFFFSCREMDCVFRSPWRILFRDTPIVIPRGSIPPGPAPPPSRPPAGGGGPQPKLAARARAHARAARACVQAQGRPALRAGRPPEVLPTMGLPPSLASPRAAACSGAARRQCAH